jgi:hypothetical protein
MSPRHGEDAHIRYDQCVYLGILCKFQKGWEFFQVCIARDGVTGQVDFHIFGMGKFDGFSELCLVKVFDSRTHTKLLPGKVHRVCSILERKLQALHISRGG